jgi:hypothetical protein
MMHITVQGSETSHKISRLFPIDRALEIRASSMSVVLVQEIGIVTFTGYYSYVSSSHVTTAMAS